MLGDGFGGFLCASGCWYVWMVSQHSFSDWMLCFSGKGVSVLHQGRGGTEPVGGGMHWWAWGPRCTADVCAHVCMCGWGRRKQALKQAHSLLGGVWESLRVK